MKTNCKKFQKQTLKKQGFTLVEFSFALAIMSVFLIMIVQIFSNAIAVYQKGLSMKAVSTAGRDTVDNLVSSISESSSSTDLSSKCDNLGDTQKNSCKNDSGQQFIYHSFNGTATINRDETSVPTYGVFCTGKYSYFWNTGYVIKEVIASGIKQVEYKNGTTSGTPRLLRFTDPSRSLCNNVAYQSAPPNTFEATDATNPVELLANDGDLKVAIYDFTVFPVSHNESNSRAFYSGTLVLGTLLDKADAAIIKTDNNVCGDSANSLSSDFTYCAINKFNFAAQALQEVKNEQKTTISN